MQLALRPSGGVETGETIGLLLRDFTDQPISRVARWIVDCRVVNFDWRFDIWLPMFQFDRTRFEIPTGVAEVMLELGDLLDGLEVAEWFAAPNSRLEGKAPADAIGLDVEGVVRAAKADRFVTRGRHRGGQR